MEISDITINNESTLLIFASGKDVITDSEIHTNFKLSSSGEFFYIYQMPLEL